MKSNRIDLLTGIGLCLVSLAVFIYAFEYSGRGVNSYGPNFFPQAIACLLFLASAGLIYQALKGRVSASIESINKAGFVKASVTLALAIIYVFAMNFVGFFIATIAFLYAVMFYLGQRKQIVLTITAFSVAGVIYGIFSVFLKIPLPEGIL